MKLCDCVGLAATPDASNEWLYGRAGYLYLLRLAKIGFTDDRETVTMIEDTPDEVIQATLRNFQPWQWHGKVYAGAVHATIGILMQIILTNPSYAPRLEPKPDPFLQNQYRER